MRDHQVVGPAVQDCDTAAGRVRGNIQVFDRQTPLSRAYSIVIEAVWNEKGVCLYLVQGNDGTVRLEMTLKFRSLKIT